MAHTKSTLHKDETEILRAEFDALKDDFAALAGTLRSLAETEEQRLGDKAGDRVVALKQAGIHQIERVKHYATDAGKAAETTLREHPGYVVAGAAAVGFLVGALTARRR